MSDHHEKLIDAQSSMHSARAILSLCEYRANNFNSSTKEVDELICSIAQDIEIANKLVLDAVQIVDDVDFGLRSEP